MNNITIRKKNCNDAIPYDLLYLADPSIDMVERYISKGECHIAILKNETVGVYLLSRKSLDTLEIVNIAVRESCQNTGVGKLLVENAVNLSKSKGVRYLEVGTGNSSISQLAFYQKCGFRIIGVDVDFFKNNYSEKIVENGIECLDMIRLRMRL